MAKPEWLQKKNKPELNTGKHATKTMVGQKIGVSDDILIDGHDYWCQRL